MYRWEGTLEVNVCAVSMQESWWEGQGWIVGGALDDSVSVRLKGGPQSSDWLFAQKLGKAWGGSGVICRSTVGGDWLRLWAGQSAATGDDWRRLKV